MRLPSEAPSNRRSFGRSACWPASEARGIHREAADGPFWRAVDRSDSAAFQAGRANAFGPSEETCGQSWGWHGRPRPLCGIQATGVLASIEKSHDEDL